MKRFILITIIFIHCEIVFSQHFTQTLRGVVIDNMSNSPLEFANIVLEGTSFSTSSDSIGNFVLKNVPVGRYSILAAMTGYEPYIAREIQITSGKEVFITISMNESTVTLNEVVLKAEVNKEKALNETATVSAKMLSVEEAKRYAGGFDDPARLVSAFAGISSNVSNNAIVVRGNNPQALQWKLEGVEIPNPNHFADLNSFGGGGLTAISSQLLANSDFFSGAFPAEYNNAISGVFDIFMRKGNNNIKEHTFQIGFTGIDAASEGPFKKGKKSSYLFNYRYSTLTLLKPFLPEGAAGVKYQDLSYKFNFPTKKAGVFSLWGIGLIDGSGSKAKTDSLEQKYDDDKTTSVVNQYMAATGLGHKLFLNKNQFIKTSLAVTANGLDIKRTIFVNPTVFEPKNKIKNQSTSLVLSSFLNTKFSAVHTNKTGFVATQLGYSTLLENRNPFTTEYQKIMDKNASSTLLAAFSNSSLHLSPKTILNMGINAQLFTLNKNYTIEPRIGVKYQYAAKQSISFAYGLHSRLERLNYYYSTNQFNEEINTNLDFSKSNHFVISYNASISEFVHIKVEPYYQFLYNVPVIKDSSFSMINQQNDFMFNSKLENTGEGKNYGVDITLDKYLSKGYYYMFTSSIFNSVYKGGDKVWRATRYNRTFAFNFLIGKEWEKGTEKQNVLGLNIRFSYQGGDHYSPVNTDRSRIEREVSFNEQNAFSNQFMPAFTSHFTASYKINRSATAHEIAFKVINATMYKEFMGFRYNYITQSIDEQRELIFVPNLSYKIEF